MKIRFFLLLSVLFLLTGQTGAATAAAPKGSFSISGHVVEQTTENGLPYATVFIVETQQGMTTDENGKFKIGNVAPGNYTLRVQYVGYETIEKKITVGSGYSPVFHFTMIPSSFVK